MQWILALAVFLWPVAALATWSQTSSVDLIDQKTQTVQEHTWTSPAVDSDRFDASSCEVTEGRFDPSTGDASTDATLLFRECAESSTATPNCRVLSFAPSSEAEWFQLNASGGFLMVDAITPTVGDTAKAELRCTTAMAATTDSSAHTIEDEGSALTDRQSLNFTGAGVTCADSGGKTVCTITSGGSATELQQTAGEIDLLYDATENLYYLDNDDDDAFSGGDFILGPDSTVYCQPEANTSGSTTAGIQECETLLQALSGTGGVISLGTGFYDFTGTTAVTIDADDIVIQGSGKGASFIRCRDADGCTGSTISEMFTITGANVTIRDLIIQTREASAGDAEAVTALVIEGDNGSLHSIQIDGNTARSAGSRTGKGIEAKGALSWSAYDTRIRGHADGLLLGDDASGVKSNDWAMFNVDIRANDEGQDNDVDAGSGADECGFRQINYFGGKIENNQRGIVVRGGAGDVRPCGNINLYGTRVEGQATIGVDVVGGSASVDPVVTFVNGHCAQNTTACIRADANTDANIIVRGTTVSDPITHAGTGNILRSGHTSNQTLPTHSGTGRVRETDKEDVSLSFTLESPTTSDDLLIGFAPFDFTVSEFACVAEGTTPSVTIAIEECDSAGATCVDGGISLTANGGEDTDTSFTDAAIDDGDYLKTAISAVSGTVDWLNCTVTGQETR